MIALAYNDNGGGVHEFELREANSVEIQLGLKYVARLGNRFIAASVLSTGAYSPDGLTLLYFDHMSPNRHIRYRSSFVTARHLEPWGGVSFDPQGTTIAFAGYGPKQRLLYSVYRARPYTIDPTGQFVVHAPKRWYLRVHPKLLTDTAGYSPVFAPKAARIFFVESGDDDTIRSTDETGGTEAVVKQFKGGWVRALAVTQNRSRAKWERFAVKMDELIVSVYFPNEGQSSIFTGVGSASAMSFTKRFSVPSDWVMVAGTGAFGGGTRILFTADYSVKVWDNRDGLVYGIQQWKRQSATHSSPEPIPGFRHYVWGSGLAISPNVEIKTKRSRSSKGKVNVRAKWGRIAR